MLNLRQDLLTSETPPGLFVCGAQYGPRIWVVGTDVTRAAILLDPWNLLPAFSYLHLGTKPLCSGTWLGRVQLDIGRPNEANRMPGRVGVINVRRHHAYVKCNGNGYVVGFPLPEFACCSDEYPTYHERWRIVSKFPSGAELILFEAPPERHWCFRYMTDPIVSPASTGASWLRADAYDRGVDDADDDTDDDDDD